MPQSLAISSIEELLYRKSSLAVVIFLVRMYWMIVVPYSFLNSWDR